MKKKTPIKIPQPTKPDYRDQPRDLPVKPKPQVPPSEKK